MKTIAIHQPNFLPWVGYLYKMIQSDVFVFLDDVMFTKNSFINRNKIKTSQGVNWLTIPVMQSGKFGQLINQTYIADKQKCLDKTIKTIEQNYKKASFFDLYFDEFISVVRNAPDNLSGFNVDLLYWITNKMNINVEFCFSSELGVEAFSGTDRLVAICESLKADVYFSGYGGLNYQEEDLFSEKKIEVQVTDFDHPVYRQLWNGFEANLSCLDLLFNVGADAKKIILNSC